MERDSSFYILKSTLKKFSGIFLSRILGLLRDVVISSFFGTTGLSDAFAVAFRIPNTFRRLFGEESMKVSVVPVFTEFKNTHSEGDSLSFIKYSFLLLGKILFVISFIGTISGPLFLPFLMDFKGDIGTAINLNYIMFFYLFFIGLTVLAASFLDSYKVFAPPAYYSIFLNISIILFTIFLAPKISVYAAAIGVIVGGILQLLFLLYFLKRVFKNSSRSTSLTDTLSKIFGGRSEDGRGKKIKFGWNNKYIKEIRKNMLPGLFGCGINQVYSFLSIYFVSLVGLSGLQLAMYLSQRVVEVIHGTVNVSISDVLLSLMSEDKSKDREGAIIEKLIFGLKTVFMVAIPAVLGIIILRKEIITVLFMRGKFDQSSVEMTATVLLFNVFALLAYGGNFVIRSAFYSHREYYLPLYTSFASLIVFFGVNFYFKGKIYGPPLSISSAAITNLFLLFYFFKRKFNIAGFSSLFKSIFQYILGALFSSYILYRLKSYLGLNFFTISFFEKTFYLLLFILITSVTYFLFLLLIGNREVNSIFKKLKGKIIS